MVINDQDSEESFTFYDHPKVLIFRKSPNYNPAQVQAVLGSVDLSNVVQLTPGQANRYKSLMLPADQLASQQAGGTWSDLFNRNAIYNRYPGLSVVLWYLVIFMLGLFTYPLVRAALPGLGDHGYPLARDGRPFALGVAGMDGRIDRTFLQQSYNSRRSWVDHPAGCVASLAPTRGTETGIEGTLEVFPAGGSSFPVFLPA